MEKLTQDQIDERLSDASEWSQLNDSISRTFEFADFVQSIRFVNQVADEAERVQHHPDILIRWNKVTLTLSTHDAGGITEKDFDLARTADDMAAGVA